MTTIVTPQKRNLKFEYELWLTVCSLACNSEPLKKRLAKAYEFHISYLDPQFIPQESNRQKLTSLINKLTKDQSMPVCEAIHLTQLKTCRKIAKDLCDIYDDFIHFEWHQNP